MIPVNLPEGRRLTLTPTEDALNEFARASKDVVHFAERILCVERGDWAHMRPRLIEEIRGHLDGVDAALVELRRVLGIGTAKEIA